jgi:hypothetical protein
MKPMMKQEVKRSLKHVRSENKKMTRVLLAKSPRGRIITHIDVKYHYVRECIAVKKIVLYHVPTEDNTADIFTKNLGRLKFEKFKQQLRIEFHP